MSKLKNKIDDKTMKQSEEVEKVISPESREREKEWERKGGEEREKKGGELVN